MEQKKNEKSSRRVSPRTAQRNRNVARGSRQNLVTRTSATSENGKDGHKKDHKNISRVPGKARLKMISLGGTGKMNKNCMVLEYDDPMLPNGGDIVVIDSGMGFPDSDMHGVDYIIADTSYLRENREKIRGVLITHAHEDHVGALPHLIQEIDLPIYATKFAAAFIEHKFSEYPVIRDKKVRVIDPEEVLRLGVFRIEPFRLAHSAPEMLGYGIHTPFGLIVYALEFRMDPDPVDGWTTDLDKIKRICQGAGGALALCSDSMNSPVAGHSLSSRVIDESFVQSFGDAKGRVIIATYSSHMSRVQQIISAAEKNGRKIAVTGRSMENNIAIALKLNYLKFKEDTIINIRDIDKYRDDQVVVITTGSLGQRYSGLVRMSDGSHSLLTLKKSDTVVLSANPIPGSEEPIVAMMDDILRLGPTVIYSKRMAVHVSGHGFRDEIEEMLRTVRPKFYIPCNGDLHMLVANRDLAMDNGYTEDNIVMFEDGDVVEFSENMVQKTSRRIPVGTVLVDGNGVGEIGNIVIRDRQAMAEEGMFVVIVTVDKKTGKAKTSPDIISRGFVYMREADSLIQGARAEIRKIVAREGKGRDEWKTTRDILRDEISDYLYKGTKRRPMVIPVVIEV